MRLATKMSFKPLPGPPELPVEDAPEDEITKPSSGKPFPLLRRFLAMAGPGLIAGAAGDDPSGIATYAQAGAQFGYGMLWTAPFAYPLLTAVQEACARIGAVTGQGLAAVIRENYSRRMLRFVVALILVANVINIGADLGGMAAAASLIVPLPFAATVAMFAVVIILLEVFVSYRAYARILKWLSLSLLSYALVALIVPEPWGEVLKATFPSCPIST